MIELPDDPAPTMVEIVPVDAGVVLRPASGASPLRVNRAGTRLSVRVSFPPMRPDTARVFNRRLMAAVREGLRIEYPLLGQSQGAPGAPVVDGDAPLGQSLPLRGLTPGYAIKEGYPLTVVDGDGNRFTHFAGNSGQAAADGTFTVQNLEPPIRGEFADGDTVLLAKPTLDLLVTGNVEWSCSVDRLIRGATIEAEEASGLSSDLVEEGTDNVAELTASETIAAGMFGNIYSSSGAKVRKANATDAAKPCNCYVPDGIANGASGTVHLPGRRIEGLSGLTPGERYYLSTTGGGITTTPPSASGNLVQYIGVALTATTLSFNPDEGTEL